MTRLLAAEGYRKSFGRNEVLKSASVWSSPGTVTVLFGRNGSGKSTLLRCMVGLATAAQGVLHFDGTSLLRPRLHRLARLGLFYLPDRALLPVRMQFRTMVARLEDARRTARDRATVLESLGVAGLGLRRPGEMSGGEARRCEWALALLSGARCIVADEPLAGIAPGDRTVIGRVLRQAARSGVAVLVTGHEVDDLLGVADEVVWMAAGTTHGLGSADQARRHDQFRREYLGPRGAGPEAPTA